MQLAAPSPACLARAVHLRLRARLAVEALRRSWPLSRVRVFGSVARGVCHAHSDLDLVIDGLPPADADRAWSIAEAAVDVPVDLLRYEDCPAHLRQAIDAEAVEP